MMLVRVCVRRIINETSRRQLLNLTPNALHRHHRFFSSSPSSTPTTWTLNEPLEKADVSPDVSPLNKPLEKGDTSTLNNEIENDEDEEPLWERISPLTKPEPPSLPGVSENQSVTWKANPTDDGTRLDRFIKRRAPSLPTGLIQKLIRQRKVRVNDEPAIRNKHPVFPNDEIRMPGNLKLGFTRGKRQPPKDDISLSESQTVRTWILHRDSRTCVLNKPAGLATVPLGPSLINPIVLQREARKKPEDRLKLGDGKGPLGSDQQRCLQDLLFGLGHGHYWLVHRLDKDVSGCIVLARDVGAAGILCEYFKERIVEKTYWALVQGWFKEKEGKIEIPIDGKRAYTKYRMIQRVDRQYAWVELQPRTGRKHQLRIHCAEGLGCPIVGDVKYGRTAGEDEELFPQVDGGGLHLMSRHVRYPTLLDASVGALRRKRRRKNGDDDRDGGPWVEVIAGLPPHMKDTWKRLGLNEAHA